MQGCSLIDGFDPGASIAFVLGSYRYSSSFADYFAWVHGCLVASTLAMILDSMLASILVLASMPLVALTTRTASGLQSLVAWILGFLVHQDADVPFDDAR